MLAKPDGGRLRSGPQWTCGKSWIAVHGFALLLLDISNNSNGLRTACWIVSDRTGQRDDLRSSNDL
jgi:hypothetical protein